jgi:hypothetical protein
MVCAGLFAAHTATIVTSKAGTVEVDCAEEHPAARAVGGRRRRLENPTDQGQWGGSPRSPRSLRWRDLEPPDLLSGRIPSPLQPPRLRHRRSLTSVPATVCG